MNCKLVKYIVTVAILTASMLPIQLHAGDSTPVKTIEASDSPSTKGGRLEVNRQSIDMGTVSADSVAKAFFTVYNTGDEPLVITRVFSDCSCAAGSFSREPVAPGDSTRVEVRFDPRNYRSTRFRRIFRIRSSAVNPYVTVVLSGKINPGKKK